MIAHVNDALDEGMVAELARRAAQLNYTTDYPTTQEHTALNQFLIIQWLKAHPWRVRMARIFAMIRGS